jgi:2,3-dihydroxy-p-cumate/2,3-dihydroxybenzoate 3,4-dioxygenase
MPTSVQSLRYRDLAYVALNVSDLEKSAWFYEEMVGMTPNGKTADMAFFRCSDRHHDILLIESATPGLKRIGWRMETPDDCLFAKEHFRKIGLDPQDVGREAASQLGISADAFRIRQPHTGAVMEFFSSMDAADKAFEPSVAKIERLGHVVVGVADLPAVERFCIDEMNFRVSDRVGDAITFFRCFPNVLHHSYALSKSDANALHHINFMVTEVDDIGKANNRFKRNKVPVTFGPGRHPTSDSMFFYFADPDGHWLEYSFGMEEIHEHDARDARLFPLAVDSIDTWGGRPDRAYPQVGAIDSSY